MNPKYSSQQWAHFSHLYQHYQQRHELASLMRWAKRKQLDEVHKAYVHRYSTIVRSLKAGEVYYPRLALLAWLAYTIHDIVRPQPRYRKRGAAARYKTPRL